MKAGGKVTHGCGVRRATARCSREEVRPSCVGHGVGVLATPWGVKGL